LGLRTITADAARPVRLRRRQHAQNPDTSGPRALDYTGPAASTADVQAFKLNVWNNLRAGNRCGACHGDGGQSPNFVRQDDINSPMRGEQGGGSVFAGRFAHGRQGCRRSQLLAAECAGLRRVLTAYITAWAGGSVGGPAKQIQLVAPPLKDAGASKSFPADASLFARHRTSPAHCTLHRLPTPIPRRHRSHRSSRSAMPRARMPP